ncbi:MAG: hypothetical protein Q3966_00690 [Neisseria sp.]|nr:hypothetical protein [Neisseria sp.]
MDKDKRNEDLAAVLLHSLRNLVDGNQARADDIEPEKYDALDAVIRMKVSWRFAAGYADRVSAGNVAAAKHFGFDNAAFVRYGGELEEAAAYDANLRADFLKGLRDLEGKGAAKAGRERKFHTFSPFSVYEECRPCRGKGKVSCGSCHGRGRKDCGNCHGTGQVAEQVSQYGGSTYQGPRTVYKSCTVCWGSGSQTCFFCSGSGSTTCSHCSGQGFFTRVREMYAAALPSFEINTDNAFHPQALADLLARSGAAFCSGKIPFRLEEEEAGGNWHKMIYTGISTVIRLPFALHGKRYVCCAFSNPPYPYVRPAVFDDLFADELAYLQQNISGKGVLAKRKAAAFFNRYAGQPVLDEAMRQIALCRTSSGQDTAHAVQTACQGFIGAETAGKLAAALNRIMDKVSPAYSPGAWLLVSLPFLAAAALLAEWGAEGGILRKTVGTMVDGGLIFLAAVAAAGALSALCSAAVVVWQRRKVPLPYRQKIRHREPFRLLARCGFWLWLASCAYGYAAAKEWLPKSEGRAVLAAVQTVCAKEDGQQPDKARSSSRFCPPWGGREDAPSETEQALYIQQRLREKGYTVAADGSFGKQSRRFARAYLEQAGRLPPDDAGLADYYQAFVDLEREGR